MFDNSRKAQGMSLNIVVMAAIALIVLIVLLAIFSTKMKMGVDKQDQAQQNIESQVCADGEHHCIVRTGTCIDQKDYIDCPQKSGCCVPN